MTVISIAFGIVLLLGLLFFAAALVFEAANRLRDRLFSPEIQLRRADLGHYPYWRR